MARKFQKRSRSRKTFRKRARGRSRATLKTTIRRVLNKTTETKFYDVAGENLQLYHNVGQSGGALIPTTQYGDPTFFNPWSDIPAGTGRANRIGDKITPLSMTIKLWIASKLDRPNLMFRVIICKMPKSVGNTLTNSNNVYIFQPSQLGATGNTMIMPIDYDRGIKPYYDRVFNLQVGFSQYGGPVNVGKECHKYLALKIRRKCSGTIVFDNAAQNIVNSPLAMYIIPYDSYGTLVVDNIASYSYSMRMYYKDT